MHERAGRLGEARALYQAMLARYDANWYGYLAKQRLDAVNRAGGDASPANFPPDSPVSRAVANLQTVTVAEETAGAAENERIEKADQLNVIGLDEWRSVSSTALSKRRPPVRVLTSPRHASIAGVAIIFRRSMCSARVIRITRR